MVQLSTQSRWQPWKGALFAAFILFMILVPGRLLQSWLGVYGLIISEFLLLAVSVGYTLLQKTPLKEVFPVKKPSLRDVFGTLILWGGVFPFGYMSIYLAAIIMPDYFAKIMNHLEDALTGDGLVSLFVIAIMAPICEEAMERGAVLSHFRSLKHEWLIVLIVGVCFGIHHTDGVRFMNTAIMGGTMAYLMVKKNNMLLPWMVHFTTNSISGVLSTVIKMPKDSDLMQQAANQVSKTASLGVCMMFFFAAPFLAVTGALLLSPKPDKTATPEERKLRSKKISRNYLIATAAASFLLIVGLVLVLTDSSVKDIFTNSLQASR